MQDRIQSQVHWGLEIVWKGRGDKYKCVYNYKKYTYDIAYSWNNNVSNLYVGLIVAAFFTNHLR